MRNINLKYTELALICFVWVVLFVTPVLFREDPVKRSISNQLEILIPVLFTFLVNRFLLVPFFLFRGKQAKYIASVLGLIAVITFGSYLYDNHWDLFSPPAGKEMNPPIPPADSPPDSQSRDVAQQHPPTPAQKRQPRPVPPFANVLVISVLIIGFDTGLRSGLRWMESENEKVRLEKENVATQLVMLQNQVSPHFFMNTLNNIHTLVDMDPDEAKEAILKLSRMMRYLLYETKTEKTSLKKEIEFLESYMDLMKLRFSKKVRISYHFPTSVPDCTLPPFLFTSFIENAFKHGISYKDQSFIDISMTTGDQRLLLVVRNSKTESSRENKTCGIGIDNSRKRLDLLYGTAYHLDIIDNPDQFTVNLSIPL